MGKIKDNLVGIDVGGTFTDLISFDSGSNSYNFTKVFTSEKNQSHGVLNAIAKAYINLQKQDLIVHGTTTTTNALLERKISKTALITTKGFRDVIELGRRTRPFPYGLIADFKPLIPRNFRFEVEERIDFKGNILKKLNEKELLQILKKIKELNCESIVIHFLHSYANPHNEKKAKMTEDAAMSAQEVQLQKRKARIDRMIAMKRTQELSKKKDGDEAPAKAMGEGASNPFQVHFDKDGKSYKSKGSKSTADKIAKNIVANRKKGPMAQDPYKSRAGESD